MGHTKIQTEAAEDNIKALDERIFKFSMPRERAHLFQHATPACTMFLSAGHPGLDPKL